MIGPGVSSECIEEKDGLYLWEDHFYPEIINPETGKVLPDGESGELVITSLPKEAFRHLFRMTFERRRRDRRACRSIAVVECRIDFLDSLNVVFCRHQFSS